MAEPPSTGSTDKNLPVTGGESPGRRVHRRLESHNARRMVRRAPLSDTEVAYETYAESFISRAHPARPRRPREVASEALVDCDDSLGKVVRTPCRA